MTIQAVKIPEERIHLSGEDVIIQILTNQLIETAGVNSQLILVLEGYAVDSETITIEYGDYKYVFTARTVFQNDGYDWPVAAATLQEYAENIKSALLQNYDFYKLFNIETLQDGANSKVILSSKDATGVSFTINNTTMTGISSQTKIDGNTSLSQDFHKLYVQLSSKNFENDQLQSLLESALSFDSLGSAEFNLKDLALSEFEDMFHFPESNNLIKQSNHAIVLHFNIAEKFGIPPIPKSQLISGNAVFVKGGVSKEFADEINVGQSIPFPVKDNTAAFQVLDFHTYQPDSKEIFYDSIEKLYYTYLHTYNSVNLFFKAYNKSGQNTGNILASEFAEIHTGMSLEVTVSPYRLNLVNYYNLEDISHYEIWLEDSNSNVISPVRTYIIKSDLPNYRRQFIFRNSRSGFDTVMCVGLQSRSIEYNRDNLQFEKLIGHTWKDAQIEDTTIFEKQKFTLSTGWISDQTKTWLRDFALSKEILEVGSDGKLYRSRITSAEIAWSKDNDFLQALNFEYVRSYQDQYFNLWDIFKPYQVVPIGGLSDFSVWPNAEDVLGVILEGSGYDSNLSMFGNNLSDGDRVLILNPGTKKGNIYKYDYSTHSWVLAKDNINRSRVYSIFDGRIFQRLDSNEYIPEALNQSIVDNGDRWTITGKVPENSSIEIHHSDNYSDIDSKWILIDPIESNLENGSYTISILKAGLKQTIRLSIIHDLYLFDPIYLTPGYSLDLIDNGIANHAGFSVSRKNSSDGSIEAQVDPNGELFALQWSTDEITSQIENLSPGEYWCEVTFESGLKIKKTIVLSNPSLISHHAVVTQPSVPGGDDGSIDLNPIGGAGGFTFLWSNDAITEDLAGLSPGNYSVIITDQNGAVGNFAFTIDAAVAEDYYVLYTEDDRSILTTEDDLYELRSEQNIDA